jgi:hypothetical protein
MDKVKQGGRGGTIKMDAHKMGLHLDHSQGLDLFERPLIDENESADFAAEMVVVLHPNVLPPSVGSVWIGDTFLIVKDDPLPRYILFPP